MAGMSKKVSLLPLANTANNSDRLVILTNPASSPSLRTIPTEDLTETMALSNTVPANSTSNGTQGTIRYDSNYIYVCVSNNVWKRSTLNSW